jgi:hypothetical protein
MPVGRGQVVAPVKHPSARLTNIPTNENALGPEQTASNSVATSQGDSLLELYAYHFAKPNDQQPGVDAEGRAGHSPICNLPYI